MRDNEEETVPVINSLLKTIAKLRAADGCPWDREQTHASLRQYLVEETYETLEVLDQLKAPGDLKKPELKAAFIDEWGDVLLQILLNAQIAHETETDVHFNAIADHLNQKMIRRHPHVFGNAQAANSDEVIKNWDEIKKSEKKPNLDGRAPSLFDSLSSGLPPLLRTMKLIKKVSKVGFQWPNLIGPTEKLEEEVRELKEALQAHAHPDTLQLEKIEDELGDVLFSVCNIAHFLKLDPETALRRTLRKFESRFRYVETKLQARNTSPDQSSLSEMDQLWDEAKIAERKGSAC